MHFSVQMTVVRHAIAILTILLAACTFARTAAAIDLYAQSKADGLAIKGYDATAYRTSGSPRPGTQAHVVKWNGATWRFAAAEDAALFKANPENYAPAFGGYCTRALSKKIVIAAAPTIWRIHKDKLYMFFAPVGLKKFDEAPEPMIAKAQAYWDTLEKTSK